MRNNDFLPLLEFTVQAVLWAMLKMCDFVLDRPCHIQISDSDIEDYKSSVKCKAALINTFLLTVAQMTTLCVTE